MYIYIIIIHIVTVWTCYLLYEVSICLNGLTCLYAYVYLFAGIPE